MKLLHDISREVDLVDRPEENPVVTGVTSDSRRVRQGFLFVTIPGLAGDGLHFAKDAVARGAAALATRAGAVVPDDLAVLRVRDERRALSQMASAFVDHPSRRLDVVGVTGTNGKSTVTYLLESIARANGEQASVIGSVHCRTGMRRESATLTTPAPEDLHLMLAETLAAGRRIAAVELSSHALDQRRCRDVELAVAVFTRITRDHLDYHGDRSSYVAAKARIIRQLRPGGTLVLDVADPETPELERAVATGTRILRYGRDEVADIRGQVIEQNVGGTRFVVREGDREVEGTMPLFGDHNLDNALAAVAAARGTGFDLEKAVAGLAEADGVPGRMERVQVAAAFDCFIDYAHTPDAFDRVLGAMRESTSGRIHCVFGCGGEKDKGKRPEMGRIAEAHCDRVILTSDNPRSEDPAVIAREIRAGMRNGSEAIFVADRDEAVHQALDHAAPGDLVLLLGKGHETFQVFSTGRVPYDERDAISAWNASREEGSS